MGHRHLGGSGNNDHGSDSCGPEAGSDSAITPIVVTADLVSAAESLGLSIRALTSGFAEIDNRSTICSARRVDGVRALLSVPRSVAPPSRRPLPLRAGSAPSRSAGCEFPRLQHRTARRRRPDAQGVRQQLPPVGAQNRVVAGQAACLYSLMRPSQRVVRTSRRGNGWSVVLLSGVVCRGGRWPSERWGRCML